ncbi:hypothetical protein SAMN05444274_101221 [Mariniphaga anaerophila]|uniref:Calcineurin-like phosphoesterase domain-containing protein n=1 Tax=Mariniphaga anaerophila TaxID=1484053 RepID=A0A1M4T122_9BACT|nr:metallophosphoesterase [Mariniphaga anaerophila]SHE38115.1 hypothetical protein SAMN05444274_101221 [Mariniphaga anaerophila]
MRSFQIVSLVIFLTLFLLAAIGARLNIKSIFGKNKVRDILFSLLNILVLLGLFVLYIFPFQAREATNYPLYFSFNTLLFLVFVFNVPLAIAWLFQSIFKKKVKQPIISSAGLVLSAAITLVMIFGAVVGSRQIKVTKIDLTFPNLPDEFDNYTVAQLSDLHLGGMLKPEKLLARTAQKLERLKPDLVLFTGDIVNNFAKEMAGKEPALKNTTKGFDSYAILGNHDYGNYSNWDSAEKKRQNFEDILDILKDSGLQLLKNEHVVIKKGADSIFLAGVENWGHPPFPQYADLNAAIRGIPSDAFTILMTHDPAHWSSKIAGKEDIELTLSGHTHGMQWGIKLAGIPFSLAWLARENWGGLYKNGSSALYVNTGLGTVGMPWRLDMPGEITLFTLKRGKVD